MQKHRDASPKAGSVVSVYSISYYYVGVKTLSYFFVGLYTCTINEVVLWLLLIE